MTTARSHMRIGETAADVRRAAREGFTGLTVGRAQGYRQANLVVVPAALTAEFLGFCEANPMACPVLGVGRPGSPALPAVGVDIDIRTDVPRYMIYENGVSTIAKTIIDEWRDDSVAIALGCWFGAEGALAAAGIRMRHVELGVQGPLFRTSIPARPFGRFRTELVLSMRPFRDDDVDRVGDITGQMPLSHGGPLPIRSPEQAGIADPDKPDWGEPLRVEEGETPLFFNCGLTATAALLDAGVTSFITHSPGSMLVTDQREGTTIRG